MDDFCATVQALTLTGRRAYWGGLEVPLTSGEFAIVEILASQRGREVSYRDIYDVVRGPGFAAGAGRDGYRVNVRAFMKRIRQKFRGVDPQFDAIDTYPGQGYGWRRGA